MANAHGTTKYVSGWAACDITSNAGLCITLCIEPPSGAFGTGAKLKTKAEDKAWCPSISPVFGGLGQLVLCLLVLSLHAQHEAPTPQLRFRLLQLVGQVKDLTRCVVCILQKCRQKSVVQGPSAWDWSNVCVCVCVQMLMHVTAHRGCTNTPSSNYPPFTSATQLVTSYPVSILLWEEFEMCICFVTEFDHPEVTLCG